jgi:hypothetical protein
MKQNNINTQNNAIKYVLRQKQCQINEFIKQKLNNENITKTSILNSLKKYYIYCTYEQNKQVNEALKGIKNPIFDVIYNHYINK